MELCDYLVRCLSASTARRSESSDVCQVSEAMKRNFSERAKGVHVSVVGR